MLSSQIFFLDTRQNTDIHIIVWDIFFKTTNFDVLAIILLVNALRDKVETYKMQLIDTNVGFKF